jgi:hypothetical protein
VAPQVQRVSKAGPFNMLCHAIVVSLWMIVLEIKQFEKLSSSNNNYPSTSGVIHASGPTSLRSSQSIIW